MIAALAMYDPPALRDVNDRLWQAILDHLPDDLRNAAPLRLTRDVDPWTVWTSPDLLLSQTCGLPFRARLHDRVQLVATPDHGALAATRGHYHSVLVRRTEDTRRLPQLAAQGVMAYNDALSQSGWAAPCAHLKALGLAPGRTLETGAHLASLDAVRKGSADFAAIDMVTWHIASQTDPARLHGVTGFAETSPTPALPFITAADRDPAPLAKALAQGIAALAPEDRALLGLAGVTQVPAPAYLALPIPAAPRA